MIAWTRASAEAHADHPGTPAEVLARLAGDEYAFVRDAVARHPGTPAEVLAQLADDECYSVR